MYRTSFYGILLLLVLGAAEPGTAEIAERCSGDEQRQFDFWLGAWEVHDAQGEFAGHNDIRRVADGCALLEHWRGVRGGEGVSINTYEVDAKRWTQRWVGAGVTLWLEGGLEEGRMVLTSPVPRNTPRGPVLDRITWAALDDGRVRQVWDVSVDDGANWQTIFEGYYSAAPSTADDNVGAQL
ncbi:MAG TPA: hypothetical protein VMQ83_00655 [Gammaproteobacteria bacterium]|nr:hypothetical protein [Gammaproteobacteria bacterium]